MRKKLFTLLFTVTLVSAFAACGKKDNNTDINKEPQATVTVAPDNNNNETPTEAPQNNQTSSIESPLALLTKVWDSYAEDDMFPAAGGDYSEENNVMGAPGNFGVADVDNLDAMLGLPQSSAASIDAAASLVHMMNLNTFTCGAFHTKDGNTKALADALKDNIMNRQWVCGFPETLVVISVDDYVVSAFGNADLIETFKKNLQAAYTNASVVYEEAIEIQF